MGMWECGLITDDFSHGPACPGTMWIKPGKCRRWMIRREAPCRTCPECEFRWETSHETILHVGRDCYGRDWLLMDPQGAVYQSYAQVVGGINLHPAHRQAGPSLGYPVIEHLRALVQEQHKHYLKRIPPRILVAGWKLDEEEGKENETLLGEKRTRRERSSSPSAPPAKRRRVSQLPPPPTNQATSRKRQLSPSAPTPKPKKVKLSNSEPQVSVSEVPLEQIVSVMIDAVKTKPDCSEKCVWLKGVFVVRHSVC